MKQYPYNPATIRMELTVCCSEHEAWDYLNTNQDSTTPNPDYLYRGQSARYLRMWPPIAEKGLLKHHYELDSIVPSDYRELEDAIAAKTVANIPLYTDESAKLRSLLTWGAVVEHGNSLRKLDSGIVVQWLNTQVQSSHRFDAIGSIGQHYGLMTGYTDASSSLAIAFWMATRNLATGGYLPYGDSVVYRWKRKELQVALDSINKSKQQTGSSMVRIVDIRSIPAQIGARPSNQSGWSLLNMEMVGVQLELVKLRVVEAVVFPRTGPCPDNCLKIDFVLPPNENIAAIFNEICNGLLFSSIRQREVDDWRNNNPGELPHINLLDTKYRNWVIR